MPYGTQPETISIHALREEGDMMPKCCCSSCRIFLSTPSARRATPSVRPEILQRRISIHALREEGDLNLSEYVDESWQFLSTPSARRATGD